MVRKIIWATIILISGTAVLSGPLVAQVDLSREPANADRLYCGPSGSASVEVRGFDEEGFAIERQRFGTDAYELETPDLSATVDDVEGCPVVIFEVVIPAFDHTSVRRFYPSSNSNEQLSLRTVGGTFQPEKVTNDSYSMTVSVVIEGDERTTVFERNLTVPVVE